MATPQETEDDYLEDCEEVAVKSCGCGCGCFHGLCLRWQRSKNGSYKNLLHQQQDQENRESWFKKRAKKVKEISEVLAGPKWKTFIRRFSSLYGMNEKRRTQMQFQYDPQGYKLNFDDGIHRELDCGHLDFSIRYAAPVGLNKGELAAS